jgi:hypothetical protein
METNLKSPRSKLLSGLCATISVAIFAVALPGLTAAAEPPSAPSGSTSVSSNVTDSSATLYGYVNPNGVETSYAFRYGTSTAYGKQTALTSVGNGTTSVKVTQAISSLAAKTTYHYRIIATSSAGTTEGGDQSFTTPAAPAPPAAPTTTTGTVSNVTYSSVILYGYVNPRGQATTYAFQYGTTTGYGLQAPLAAAGSGISNTRVSQALTGLQPFTLYHFRIIASSSAGKALGTDHTFTTGKLPLSLQIVGSPNPVAFGSPFLIEGTLSGTGGANHEIMLQVKQFPYTGAFVNAGNPELTNSLGGFSFPVLGLTQNAQLRVVTVGKPSLTSPVLTEGVAVRVTFHARRTHRHGVYRLYGTVTPAEVGALVGFQLLSPGHRSKNEGGTAVREENSKISRFSRRVHIRHRGLYRALVKINDGAHVSNYSAPIVIR